jgi:hypothetical protein
MTDLWIIASSPSGDLRHPLPASGRVTIGRSQDAGIVLEGRTVSRRHARLEWMPGAGAWRIVNESGNSGTWVNGRRLGAGSGLELRPGDAIGIPPWELRLVASDGPLAVAELQQESGGVQPLQVPGHDSLGQDRLVFLLAAAEAIHAAPGADEARAALVDAAVRAAGFDGASLLRSAGAGAVEVLATAGRIARDAGFSRTMVQRALAGEPTVGNLSASGGSAVAGSLLRLKLAQAVCVPVDVGTGAPEVLWMGSATERPPAALAEAAAVAGALARIAGHAVSAHGRAEMEQRFAAERAQMFSGTLLALIRAIDAKDPYTRGHSDRVAMFAQLLARTAGLDDETVARSHLCGLVHDLGKIGVPEAVLRKPGRLTDEEFARIREHPTIGHRILSDIPQLQDVLPGVLEHHERWDGRGYPGGLAGESISLLGRIVCVADCFDAMTSARVYRPGRPIAEVLEEIRRCAGTHFDPALAEAFASIPLAQLESLVAAPVD